MQVGVVDHSVPTQQDQEGSKRNVRCLDVYSEIVQEDTIVQAAFPLAHHNASNGQSTSCVSAESKTIPIQNTGLGQLIDPIALVFSLITNKHKHIRFNTIVFGTDSD